MCTCFFDKTLSSFAGSNPSVRTSVILLKQLFSVPSDVYICPMSAHQYLWICFEKLHCPRSFLAVHTALKSSYRETCFDLATAVLAAATSGPPRLTGVCTQQAFVCFVMSSAGVFTNCLQSLGFSAMNVPLPLFSRQYS